MIMIEAYLNEKNVDEVRKLPNISSVSFPVMVHFDKFDNIIEEEEEEETICFEVEDNDESIVDEVEPTTTSDVTATATTSPEVQCFSIALSYPCCSKYAEAIFEDDDGKWTVENNEWCIIDSNPEEPVNSEEPVNPEEPGKKNDNIICEKKVKQLFYDIMLSYPDGGINTLDPKYIEFLDNLIESIHDIIIKTRNTYPNPEELDKLDEGYPKDDIFSRYIQKYGTVSCYSQIEGGDSMMCQAYLNKKNVDEVRNLPNVVFAEPPFIIKSKEPKKNGWNIIGDDYTFGYLTNEEDEEEETICHEVDDTVDEDQCFSFSLGYPCCSQGAEIVYDDGDEKWGYENDRWCGINN